MQTSNHGPRNTWVEVGYVAKNVFVDGSSDHACGWGPRHLRADDGSASFFSITWHRNLQRAQLVVVVVAANDAGAAADAGAGAGVGAVAVAVAVAVGALAVFCS